MTLIEAYERELADGSFCDWPGVLLLVTDAIKSPDRHRLVGLPTLLLDVAIATEAELAFVTALVAAAPTLLATVPAADAVTLAHFRGPRALGGDRLHLMVEDLDAASAMAERAGPSNGALARLQRYLFNERDKPPEAKAGNETEVFSAPGEGRECVEIVRRVSHSHVTA